LIGPLANVRVYWHLDLTAVGRWDQHPAKGANVTIHDGLDPDAPFLQGTTSDDGRLSRKWLLEKTVDPFQETVHTPFHVVIKNPGVIGEVDLPGNTSWEVIVELIDISPPDLVIRTPVPGTIFNVTFVSFSGTIEEIGSGLFEMEASLDGGLWEPLGVALDHWTIQFEIYDGTHDFSVRASDLDGNQVIADTWVTIDTVRPLVSFTQPEPSTPFSHEAVTLKGFILLGEGTPIVNCFVDDLAIPISPNGTFEILVTLMEEGENLLVVEAWDSAGNRGEAHIVLVRDTSAPVVHLEDVPGLTRSTILWVNGTIDDVTRVDVTLDGMYVPVTEDGDFTLNVSLDPGRNRMVLEVVDAVGNHVRRELDVVCDNLINGTIVQPIQGATVKGSLVTIEVTTDPRTWVRVVDRTDWTLSNLNGSLMLFVELEPGANHTLTVEFRDEANNLLVKAVVISVRKPKVEGSQGGLPLWSILLIVLLVLIVMILIFRLRMNGDHPV